jgi:transcriptional regulator with XRE-family HTH domain/DNA-directed RNA polymerase subunit RPC12/RpoP
MNQIKIGKFIAECRKSVNLTQLQLAEKLGITDKAISKWERGISMPDTSIMLELCEILGISVNELLSGERIQMENIDRQNEQVLLEMAKELEKKNKSVWTSMWIIMVLAILGLFGGIAVAAFLIPQGIWQLVVIIGVVIVFFIPCLYSLKLEISIGAYKCKNCGHEFIPTFKQALFAQHLSTTRKLKCPECAKRTWCKKIIKK